MIYKYVLINEAQKELDQELAYSEQKWGPAHAKRYAIAIRKKIRDICKSPKVYPLLSNILPEVRLARFKGNHIIYTLQENQQTVIILGIPSIYRELAPTRLRQLLKKSIKLN